MNKALLFIIISVLATSCKNYTDRLFISTEQPVLPVLTMKEANPVLKIEVIRKQPGNYSLQQLAFDLSGTTDIDDIESIGLYQANSKGMLDTDSCPCIRKYNIQYRYLPGDRYNLTLGFI